MNTIGAFLVSQTVLIPLLIGLIRFNRTVASFQPFLLLLALAFISETISYICIKELDTSNAVPFNLYGLAESMVILYQFYIWGFLKRKRVLFIGLVGGLASLWITENLVFNKIEAFSPMFRVAYAFIVVLLSINEINFMIVRDNKNLLKNSRFLVCLGFITFFIYQIIYEASYFVGTDSSAVPLKIIFMFNYINGFVNLIYAIAVLYIPVKEEYYFNKHFDA
ncbi:hypothetical protein SAMN05518672_114124 [Chitinophaga sp. CF118]|uniref:hypothetical protein n=1 Tax=Chitinophaga sp. CF118 TaxID=1884367 RepID=UPI0008EE9CEE|nr:hypothetical protein [Chitinophaga sp. CF118]SFF03046.1 hypothetical protein SAMN05518672_114124 [Chitinophaga sp. CF118]